MWMIFDKICSQCRENHVRRTLPVKEAPLCFLLAAADNLAAIVTVPQNLSGAVKKSGECLRN